MKLGPDNQSSSGAPLRVLEISVYRGPNVFSQLPVIRIRLDLGELEHWPTDQLPGFSRRLEEALPGIAEHGCSYGEDGGFLQRMDEGTWLGHVIEHVALQLQNEAGADVGRGKTRGVRGQPGVYDIVYSYEDEATGLLGGRLAIELVTGQLPLNVRQGVEGMDKIAPAVVAEPRAQSAIEALRALHEKSAFGPTTAAIVREAHRRNITCRRLNGSGLVQLGQGALQKRIAASCTGLTSLVAGDIASDKQVTKHLLAEAGLPVPRGENVSSAAQAVAAANRIGFPVVIKPLDGNHGRGVNIGLSTASEVEWGFGQASQEGAEILVEQQLDGADHRVLVIGGKIAAVAQRLPAHVTGDGERTIAELVEIENRDPRRGEGHANVLTRIDLDDCARYFIGRRGLTPESVPPQGKTVYLRPTANISTGGTAMDRTDEIHPENAAAAIRAARIVGLDVAGIDFISADISQPFSQTGGGIIEVNAGPGFRMHLEPSAGQPRNVAGNVLDMLFPHGSEGRIPVFAITGTNGKTTTANMLASILAQANLKVGLTSTSGVHIGGEKVVGGDCSGPRSARMVLADPSVEAAVLETARGGILREGLGFDQCDVGAVLNVQCDHLGLNGIETLDELALVKSVVVEAVRPGGWSILNADDPQSRSLASIAGGQLCYITMQDEAQWPQFLTDHASDGGRVVHSQHGAIVIREANASILVMDAAAIPATFGGAADFNIANALAAIAMAHAHGIEIPVIRSALAGFTSDHETLPGRLNMIEHQGCRMIVDYAHNPHGLEALARFASRLQRPGGRTIGMIGMPGDRRDEDIRAMGAIAAGFIDHLVLREDEDLRGRAPGEVSALIIEGTRQSGRKGITIETIRSEGDAADHCLEMAQPGDIVLLTGEDVEELWRRARAFTCKPRDRSVRMAGWDVQRRTG